MGSEMPLPGSIISLISNAQMRYEGTLELIKMGPEESSLSLSNVRSFGTENRVDLTRQVPPADDPFEFVVFKGTDIISLDVKEYYRGPPRQSYIPAPPQHPPPEKAQADNNVWGPPGNASQQGGVWSSHGQPPTHNQSTPSQYGQPSSAATPQAATHQAPIPGPAPTVVVTPSLAPRPQGQPRQATARQQSPAWSNDKPGPQSREFAAAKPPGSSAPSQGRGSQGHSRGGPPPGFSAPPGISRPPTAAAAPRQPPSSYANAAGASSHELMANGNSERPGRRGRGPPRGRGHPPRRGSGGERGPPRPPPVPVPTEDFNFEEALLRFNKDKLKEEADTTEYTEEVVATPQAYNKDDFFDSLSSETQDRLHTGEQRRPFSVQRKVDAETFGGSGVSRRPLRGRGRGGRAPGREGRGGRRAPRSDYRNADDISTARPVAVT